MGASSFPGLKFPKPVGSMEMEEVRKRRRTRDEQESDKVRERSGGRCEIRIVGEPPCEAMALHVHHMIGGRTRGRGASALAQHKQHACCSHHVAIGGSIGGKRLERVGDPKTPWWTDQYRRVK